MIFFRLVFVIHLTNAAFLFFDRDSYEFYVSEASPINTRIGSIKATSTASLIVQYELYGDTNSMFTLNSSTGELSLSNALDYETIPLHRLTIEGRSASSTIAPCFSEIIIHVLNTNDNPPDINLVFYPSILSESNVVKYDLNTYSTALATINLKDLDESTKNLSLSINDTEHFQLQFVRQSKNGLITESIYILFTKNNAQLSNDEDYYLSLNSCDNDQPPLWTNRSYEFHLKANENVCQFLSHENHSLIDIQENLPNRSLISHRLTNPFCENIYYSIDDTNNFFIHPQTGNLYTSTTFNRKKQSIHTIHLRAVDPYRREMKRRITIRILDESGRIPFLTKKHFQLDRNDFSSIDLFNSSLCRNESIIYDYFQLFSNCTLARLSSLPSTGKYLFYIQLDSTSNYEDTFLLELTSNSLLPLIQSQWMLIIPIVLGIFFMMMIITCAMVLVRRRKYSHTRRRKQKPSPSSLSSSNDNVHNKYDAISTLSKLKVHDDHELSPSPTTTAIYLVHKSVSPLSSASPARDDEGYSGSSDVSENHLPVEATILAADQLLEQYRIHDFRIRQSLSPSSYDTPRQMDVTCVSPDVSLV